MSPVRGTSRETVFVLLQVFALGLFPLGSAAAAKSSVGPERPDCPTLEATPRALCPCLTRARWDESGSDPNVDLSEVECSVEFFGEDVAVIAAGGYELSGISHYLAIRAPARTAGPNVAQWSAVARVGEKLISGTGGHYSEFEIEEVRKIERGAMRFLWVESRSSFGYWHFDGSEGDQESLDVTLCRLPDASGRQASCPLQVPTFLSSRRSMADESNERDGTSEHDEGESGPLDREHEKSARLKISINADGSAAEVSLLEGEVSGALEEKLGTHVLEE